MHRPKLFHTLVAMGVSLTGGTFATLACTGGAGSTTTGNQQCDPQHDPGCVYPNISADCRPGTTCYPNISPTAPPPDASNDHYATISPCLDCGGAPDAANDHYPNISPAPPPDGG